MSDLERLNEIEKLSRFSTQGDPRSHLLSEEQVEFVFSAARRAIEAAAAPSEVKAAVACYMRPEQYETREECISACLQAAAAWRKAHEPKPAENEIDVLSKIAELEADRDQHAAAAGTALDRNRDLLIENAALRAKVAETLASEDPKPPIGWPYITKQYGETD